jgi:hypothetical protein
MSRRIKLLPVLALAAVLVALPGGGMSQNAFVPGARTLAHLSQPVSARYWLAHPEQAPPGFLERFTKLAGTSKKAGGGGGASALPAFNNDVFGLPQNEESIAACRADTNVVLGGTNDYRGLVDPDVNFTGWHFSSDGGATLAKEGLLPAVTLPVSGNVVPSGGDPVDVADGTCNLYAGSLAYNPDDPFSNPSGIVVYRTTPATLASSTCGDNGPSDADCWPTRKVVAESAPNHFLDKEWLDVGVENGVQYVWVVYSDFNLAPTAGSFSASIEAVRCSADLASCTSPILISGSDQDIQFGDVTIGGDGRTYVTWAEIQGELAGTAQTFIPKLRIAPAGSTAFGPTRVIATETKPLPFGGFLQGNDFRVATYPKNAVSMVRGKARIFVVWDGCLERPLDTICEQPQIKLTSSSSDGAGWTNPKVISAGGVNYFPTISDDGSGRLAVAWYTNRFDSTFQNAQDVELATVDADSAKASDPVRLTPVSNETEADPLLGGFFIGDYFETFAYRGTAWVHFNANYRSTQLLGTGVPVPQQDNYLVKHGL